MNRSLSSRQMKKQKKFSTRISEMRSWFPFKQLPASCGRWPVAGSSAYADAVGGCNNG